jgi:hypothetical protein
MELQEPVVTKVRMAEHMERMDRMEGCLPRGAMEVSVTSDSPESLVNLEQFRFRELSTIIRSNSNSISTVTNCW